jgi:putative endonuclease
VTKQSSKQPAVYILANKRNGTLYTGVTSSLVQRIWQHKSKTVGGFSQKYDCTNLVYFEIYEDMEQAIMREKQIKSGSRKKKIELIESLNPEWNDLYSGIAQ